MRGRWYDPELGRFIQEDPVHSGVNDYTFAGDDPINGSDPSGLDGDPTCVTFSTGITQCSDWTGQLSAVTITAGGPGVDWSGFWNTLVSGLGTSTGLGPSGGTGAGPIHPQPKPAQPKPTSWLRRFLSHPHVCAGGGFFYAGREVALAKIFHAELVGLVEYDTKSGGAHGGLIGGVGPFTVAYESMRQWRDGSMTNSVVGLGGGHVGKFELGGIFAPSPGGFTVGGYGGMGVLGGGGYASLSAEPCVQ